MTEGEPERPNRWIDDIRGYHTFGADALMPLVHWIDHLEQCLADEQRKAPLRRTAMISGIVTALVACAVGFLLIGTALKASGHG